ncbi:MAG: sulfurtransferase [Magnetococcales bacterium]|nr:sulfurtransferase [Magnetococcales bacterium]
MTSNAQASVDNPFPALFVESQWLEEHLQDSSFRIIQIGGERYYPQMHIPGAALLSFRDLVTLRNTVPGMRADPELLAELLGRMGITLQTPVLFYDVGSGMDAARGVWTLASLGHSALAQLDGGLGVWYREKRVMDSLATPFPACSFLPQPTLEWEATADEVLAVASTEGATLLLDTRTPEEYQGLTAREPRGHIAGARLFNWLDALLGTHDPRLKPPAELLSLFARLGIEDRQQEIILYCETAHRAAHTWLLLRHLGFHKVRLYDGSIAEWRYLGHPVVAGNAPYAPA